MASPGKQVVAQTIGRPGSLEIDDLPRRSESQESQLAYIEAGVGKRSLRVRCVRVLRASLNFLCFGFMLVCFGSALVDWPKQLVEEEVPRAHVLSALFCVGLFLVAMEDLVHVNKSAVMLLLAAVMWTVLAVGYHPRDSERGAEALHHEMNAGIQDVGQVVLFLLPAMGVVETIDHLQGFVVVTHIINKIMAGRKNRLMPIVCVLVFFLSSVIDNLTATIVALKILRRLIKDDDEWRKECGALVVIAANAGGAWSPIGDVTTTMLWIQGKITTTNTVIYLIGPSMVAGIFPLFGFMLQRRLRRSSKKRHAEQSMSPKQKAVYGEVGTSREIEELHKLKTSREIEELERESGDESDDFVPNDEVSADKVVALVLGFTCVLMVPAMKTWTGLPPFLGMLLALGVMWLVTDCIGFGGVMAALHKVDLTGLLFFTGVLFSVSALDSAGVLREYAHFLLSTFGKSPVALCTLLGVSSAVVDNVPLVSASLEMFEDTPTDDALWQLIALAAGTGGSILSIGSIAGVTFMSMENIGFMWYVRRASLWAILGFFGGILAYKSQLYLLGFDLD